MYAVCYLHIKQIATSRQRRVIWKNYRCRWSSFIISRVLSNKTLTTHSKSDIEDPKSLNVKTVLHVNEIQNKLVH